MKRIAINGFGRIGRLFFRNVLKDKSLNIVAINDLTDPRTLAHLLKYDSVYRQLDAKVSYDSKNIIVNGKKIPIFAEKDPELLPWKQLKVDLVVECTGKFVSLDGASKHIKAGAKKVLISAPAKGGDVKTIVYGVNHKILTKNDVIVSGASCTTNALAPLAKIINDKYGIVKGFMTTIHAYTADQRLQDAPHKDLRRSRAAGVSMVPTTTGAAKAIGLVIPELKGKMHGIAVRVPTITGSIVDLVLELKKSPSVEEINKFVKSKCSDTLGYNDDEIVSADIIGQTHGSIFDPNLTMMLEVDGKRLYKLFTWYDNEASYTCQLIRTLKYLLSL